MRPDKINKKTDENKQDYLSKLRANENVTKWKKSDRYQRFLTHHLAPDPAENFWTICVRGKSKTKFAGSLAVDTKTQGFKHGLRDIVFVLIIVVAVVIVFFVIVATCQWYLRERIGNETKLPRGAPFFSSCRTILPIIDTLNPFRFDFDAGVLTNWRRDEPTADGETIRWTERRARKYLKSWRCLDAGRGRVFID